MALACSLTFSTGCLLRTVLKSLIRLGTTVACAKISAVISNFHRAFNALVALTTVTSPLATCRSKDDDVADSSSVYPTLAASSDFKAYSTLGDDDFGNGELVGSGEEEEEEEEEEETAAAVAWVSSGGAGDEDSAEEGT
jgi:hypothetical protein